MKKIKKIFALLIAMIMVLGMSTTVFAGTITINRDETYGGEDGRTYTAYKVFDADTVLSGSNNQGNKEPEYTIDGPIAYSMAIDSPWLSAMQNDAQTWFDVKLAANENIYVVTLKEGVEETDAADIASYLKNNLPAGLTGTTITPGTAAEVENGYYLIVASDGATNVTLVTTDVTIVEKNTYITTTKTTDETSYNIGDTIKYTATVSVPLDASLTDPIILHDKMDPVLAFDKESVMATLDEQNFMEFNLVESVDDDCTFEISIPVTEDILGKTITFTYDAELTSAAEDPDTGFINTLYGEKNGYTTTPDTVTVYTFDFNFIKNFEGSNSDTLNATFELRTVAGDQTTAIAFKSVSGGYVKADSDDTDTITTITMTNGTPANFQGLKAGTYYLVETGTSAGYNLLDEPVSVTITDNSATDLTSIRHSVDPVNTSNQVEVENNTGTILPSTGGVGTTMFYVIGGALVLVAVVLLVTRKRMSVEK